MLSRQFRPSVPVKESFVPLESSDGRYVLAHLEDPSVITPAVAHCEVPDVYEPLPHLYPEFRAVLVAGLEFPEDLLHYMHALGRMTVLDTPADDARAPRKDPVLCLRVICDFVIFVYEGYVDRQVSKEEVDLLRCQQSCVQSNGDRDSNGVGALKEHAVKAGSQQSIYLRMHFPNSNVATKKAGYALDCCSPFLALSCSGSIFKAFWKLLRPFFFMPALT